MLTDRGFFAPSTDRRDVAGVALVVTLALLVLVTVAVVAFFSRTATNQQITSSSANGVVATTFADGATQEIIGGLQKEMWDLSGTSQVNPPISPAIFPIPPLPNTVSNRIQGVVPTRMVGPNVPTFPGDGTAPDPNANYSQFANLIKQSFTGKATYTGTSGINSSGAAGPAVTGQLNASDVPTNIAAVNGRTLDGIYWNQPQLVSVSSTSATAAADLKPLVPDWVYTTRAGDHPTTFSKTLLPSANGTLDSTSVVGRYAYNIYDIGGLLNANVAGYGTGVRTQPSFADKASMIVPGYKGSVLMADLSAMNLNGNLNTNGANANTFAASNANSLPKFRHPDPAPNDWATDFSKLFASGQYAGWLSPFLTTYDLTASGYGTLSSSLPLKNNSFTSRQDLITWVNSQLGGGTTTAAWTLPYLTHFSYDTDAPSFTPNVSRPRSNVTLGATGGNDSSSANDDLTNPAFTAVLDATGNPLVKRRFPLSALSLLDNIYPGNVPADLLNANSDLSKQVQYDFGLVWDNANNCWDYKDFDGDSGAIKQLPTAVNHGSGTVPTKRSPNFFELLKAAITAGSLGKQWGAGSFDGDTDNTLGKPRYRANVYQIIQIGANIISQSTTNYCPTAICLFGQGQAPIIYGVKDLPYLYRSRLLTMTVDTFTGTSMQDKHYTPPANSVLAAVMVQPELWNPHAPNLLAPTALYPKMFRVVPKATNAVGVSVYSTHPNGTTQWAEGPDTTTGTVATDYRSIGGPYCPAVLTYDDTVPDAYLSFSSVPPNTSPDILGSFREPCPLAAPNFPPGIDLTGFPINPTMAAGDKVMWDKKPNTTIVSKLPTTAQNTIPVRLGGGPNGSTSSNTALGFLVGYCCGGPKQNLTVMNGPTGGPMSLELQYSMDKTHFYTYDTIQSAFPDNQTENMAPGGAQQTLTGIRTDPRTHRWGLIWTNIPYGQYIYGSGTYIPNTTYDNLAGLTYSPSSNLGTTNYGTGGNQKSLPKAPGWMGALNTTTSPFVLQMAWSQVNQSSGAGYYQDPDGITRRADGAYVSTAGMSTASGSTSSAVGLPQAMLAVTGNTQTSAPGITTYDSRPIVLNRPFQSVAELGYAFRDTPWRSLDFFTPESGDAALLDIFTVYGPDPYSYMSTFTTETGLVAGRVNLNTPQQPVLAALLKGASVTTVLPNSDFPASSMNMSLTTLNDMQAAAISKALVQWTTNSKMTPSSIQGPLLNRADLVGRYTGATGTGATGFNGFSDTLSATTSPILTGEPAVIKQQRECVMHALADAGTTRTWNLLVDLVAQTGQLSQNAEKAQPSQPLGSFIVNGERHMWVSVALDRVTGKVIKMQIESVRL